MDILLQYAEPSATRPPLVRRSRDVNVVSYHSLAQCVVKIRYIDAEMANNAALHQHRVC